MTDKKKHSGLNLLPNEKILFNRLFENARERCFNAGMDEYISKPLNTRKLNVTINRVKKKAHYLIRIGEPHAQTAYC